MSNNNKQNKKELVMGNNKKDKISSIIIGTTLGGVLLALIFISTNRNNNNYQETLSAVQEDSENITENKIISNGKVIKFKTALFSDGKARFFKFNNNGKEINYFILKSSDGVIRAAFDACDVCFRSKRGYQQVGNDMVCQNCGRHFPSISVNEVEGGCNPAPLARAVKGDSLYIKTTDIKKGAKYF